METLKYYNQYNRKSEEEIKKTRKITKNRINRRYYIKADFREQKKRLLWTPQEKLEILNKHFSDRVLALRLKRSINTIQVYRSILKRGFYLKNGEKIFVSI